jgi:hypothetical protein
VSKQLSQYENQKSLYFSQARQGAMNSTSASVDLELILPPIALGCFVSYMIAFFLLLW